MPLDEPLSLYGLQRRKIMPIQKRTPYSLLEQIKNSFCKAISNIILGFRRLEIISLEKSACLQWATENYASPVETVEKGTFQKLFLKSGAETLKIALFFIFRATFWRFLNRLWEIFARVFQTKCINTWEQTLNTARSILIEKGMWHPEKTGRKKSGSASEPHGGLSGSSLEC